MRSEKLLKHILAVVLVLGIVIPIGGFVFPLESLADDTSISFTISNTPAWQDKGLEVQAGDTVQSTSGENGMEISYDDGSTEFGWATTGLEHGVAVLFTPPTTPWMLSSIKVQAWYAGNDAPFYVEIWDENRNELFRGTYAYSDYFTSTSAFTWAEIDIPDIEVTGDFYVCVFPNDVWLELWIPVHVLWMCFDDDPPDSGRSYDAVYTTNTLGYVQDWDWMIRAKGTRNYALFIGSHKPWSREKGGYLKNNPHADAECLMASLNRYMHFSTVTDVEHLMKLEYEDDGNGDKIESAIIEIGNEMTAGDKFVFYYSGHGATDDPEESTTQALSVGHDYQIWDSELETWLNDYIPVQSRKIIILDTCYSGGFWSDALINVPNTILMASAREGNFSYRHLITGRNLYTNQLIDGLTPTTPGGNTARADSDENGLTFQELHDWAFDNLIREKQDFEGEDLPVSALYMPDGAYPWLEVSAAIFGPNELLNDVVGLPSAENNKPVADAGVDQVVQQSTCDGAEVTLDGSGSSDPDGDPLAYTWTWDADTVNGVNPTVKLPLGTTSITLVVNDGQVDSEPDTVDVTVLLRATTDFDPNTLNLKSKHKYVTAYIELPPGFDARQIDISSIRLNGIVPPLPKPTGIGDDDSDSVPDLMVKFDASAVKSLLAPGDEVEIIITGEVAGIGFQGTDTIRVINP